MGKRFGKRVFAVEYEHDRDGGYYRHDFDSPTASLVADDDKSLRIVSRAGLPLWDEYVGADGTSRIMMQNPRGRKMKRKRKASHRRRPRRGITKAFKRSVARLLRAKSLTVGARPARRRSTSRRKAVRRNPAGVPAWVRAKGFSSWAAYMASIRPGSSRTRRASSGGGTVAKRRRSTARRRTSHSAPRRRRRHARRSFLSNPFGIKLGGGGHTMTFRPKSLIQTAIHGAVDGVVGTVGLGTARLIRGKIPFAAEGNTIKGGAVELLVGIGAGTGLALVFGDGIARAFVQGAFMGPLTSLAKSKLAPTNPLAVALGDEGELPLFGGLYELGGTYDLNGGRRLAAPANAGLGGEGVEVGMM